MHRLRTLVETGTFVASGTAMKALCWTGLEGIIMAVLTENWRIPQVATKFGSVFPSKGLVVVASFHTCLEDCVTARDPVNRASGCWYTDNQFAGRSQHGLLSHFEQASFLSCCRIWFRPCFLPKVYVVASFHKCWNAA